MLCGKEIAVFEIYFPNLFFFFKSHSPAKDFFFSNVYFKHPLSFTSGWNLSYFDWHNRLQGHFLKHNKKSVKRVPQRDSRTKFSEEAAGNIPLDKMGPKPQPSLPTFSQPE